jgi:hypothetical protein
MSTKSTTSVKTIVSTVAIGAALGAAVTIGVAYPALKDKWVNDAPAAPKAKLACANAQPQSPRDVSAGSAATGKARVRVDGNASPIGNADDAKNLKHVNTHFHLGAEHKSSGEYDKLHVTPSGRRLLDASTEYGFYCDDVSWIQPLSTTAYDWQYCENTEVGKTYEVHWVYSSGGASGDITDGLGGALAYQNNPTVTVRAQVYHVVNDATYNVAGLVDGWKFPALQAIDTVTYSGSTTGRSYNNDDSCSPLQVTWQVDRKCQAISASSFDDMCKAMKDRGMSADLEPHASRDLVSAALSSDDLVTLTSTGRA